MNGKKGMIVFIVDDNPQALETLACDLKAQPEIAEVYTFRNYSEATLPLLEMQPDALFLDVEVPGKSGLDFLHSIKPRLNFTFKTVFYSAFSEYMLDAIRQSAFDFLLKPYKSTELRTIITRLAEPDRPMPNVPTGSSLPRKLAIQTVRELLLVTIEQILMFNYVSEHRSWQLILTDRTTHALKKSATAESILQFNPLLSRVSSTCILNLTYLAAVENTTQHCRLCPPYEDYEIVASRRHFAKLRERLESL